MYYSVMLLYSNETGNSISNNKTGHNGRGPAHAFFLAEAYAPAAVWRRYNGIANPHQNPVYNPKLPRSDRGRFKHYEKTK